VRTSFAPIAALTVLACSACRFEPQTALGRAAAAGQADVVRQALAQGSSPDAPDYGFTPLMIAARRGHVVTMTVLIDAGADVNANDRAVNGWTPIMHALHKQQRAAVRLLLDRGADANRASPHGQTALMMAALDNDAEIVGWLLDRGADPSARTETGGSALDVAVSGGAFVDVDRPILGRCSTDTVRTLLAKRPDLKLQGGFGPLSARWWARVKGCDEVVALVGSAK
jgi:Ankyrin repeats (many copies)/Ankyrin repeats (3 copies)